MDPDEVVFDCDEDNAEEGNHILLMLRKRLAEYYGSAYGSDEEDVAMRQAIAQFEMLDEHLKGGGSLPTDWDVAP